MNMNLIESSMPKTLPPQESKNSETRLKEPAGPKDFSTLFQMANHKNKASADRPSEQSVEEASPNDPIESELSFLDQNAIDSESEIMIKSLDHLNVEDDSNPEEAMEFLTASPPPLINDLNVIMALNPDSRSTATLDLTHKASLESQDETQRSKQEPFYNPESQKSATEALENLAEGLKSKDNAATHILEVSMPTVDEASEKDALNPSKATELSFNPLLTDIQPLQEQELIFQNLTEFIHARIQNLNDSSPQNLATESKLSLPNPFNLEAKATLLDIQRSVAEAPSNFKINNYTAKISLHPPELGSINAEIIMQKGQAELKILTESDLMKQVIESHLEQLKTNFKDANFNLNQVHVETHQTFQERSMKDNPNRHPSPFKNETWLLNDTETIIKKDKPTLKTMIDAYA